MAPTQKSESSRGAPFTELTTSIPISAEEAEWPAFRIYDELRAQKDMSEGLTQEESWVPIEVWERVKKNMSKYEVGDVIPHDAFLGGGNPLPPGTVLVEVGSWKVRIFANHEENDGFVFEDRLGWYGVDEFHIVHIPEPAEEVDEVEELATSVLRVYMEDDDVRLEYSRFADDWRRVAQYVLDNYEPKN